MESLLFGDEFLCSPRTGELGRLPYGVAGKTEPVAGDRVKRKSFAESCQNVRLEMNISVHPSGVFSSGGSPTDDSSDASNPIRSNFCMRFRPRKTPSLLTFSLHSPFGLAPCGVLLEASDISSRLGGGRWKYQFRVAHSIIAICRVGLVGALKSLLEGFDIEEMKRLSF